MIRYEYHDSCTLDTIWLLTITKDPWLRDDSRINVDRIYKLK